MRTGFVIGTAGGLALAGLLVFPASTRPTRPAEAVPSEPPAVAQAVSTPVAEVNAPATPVRRNGSNAPQAQAAFAAGMVVEVDPATGALIAPERRGGRALTIDELQAIARREGEGLVTIRNADGSESLTHEGRFAHHSVIRIGPDGKQVFQCAHGDHAAKGALHPNAPAAVGAEEE